MSILEFLETDITICGKRAVADVIVFKILRWEIIPNYLNRHHEPCHCHGPEKRDPGGVNVITNAEVGDAIWRCRKEHKPRSTDNQEKWGVGGEANRCSPQSLQLCWWLDSSPIKLTPQDHKRIPWCCLKPFSWWQFVTVARGKERTHWLTVPALSCYSFQTNVALTLGELAVTAQFRGYNHIFGYSNE